MSRSLTLPRKRRTAARSAAAVLAGPVLAMSLAAAPALAAGGAAAARAAHPAGGTWAVQKSPNRTVSTSTLQAVSCPAANWCIAVGLTYNSTGAAVALAEVWNGTSWTRQPIPSPAASGPELAGVSCVSAHFCEAVGSYTSLDGQARLLGEAWNGRAWRLQTIPSPAHSPGYNKLGLAGVSCTSAHFCEAVGFSQLKDTRQTLADVWNGSSWALQPTPDPSQSFDSQIDGVSCASAKFCEAVGGEDENSGFALRWNGTAWVLQALTGATVSVSCTATDFCEAAGRGDADVWNGSTWTAQTFPSSSNPDISGLSCVSADFCEATGHLSVGTFPNSVETAYSALWNGTTWAQQSIPSRPSSQSTLSGVSCASARGCETVGSWATAPTESSYFAAQTRVIGWDGTSWTLQHAPSVAADLGSELEAVSCVSAEFCEAVGSSDGLSQENSLAEQWNGTSWTIQAAPGSAPGGGGFFQANGVSCVSASFCEAVGATSISQAPSAAVWNGSTWTAQTVPPGSAAEVLKGVSCVSADFCMAVAQNSDAYIWDGTAWSGPTATSPGGPSGLFGVSCVSADFCEAVGGPTSTFSANTAAEEWDGSTWTPQSVHIPANGNSVTGLAVSCVSVRACELTGEYGIAHEAKSRYLSFGWNGSVWFRHAVTTPSNAFAGALEGVSCVSVHDCTAIGRTVHFFNGETLFLQQVAAWNGTTWTVSDPVQPVLPNSQLSGLSCTAPATCEAVGSNSAGREESSLATLVEAES